MYKTDENVNQDSISCIDIINLNKKESQTLKDEFSNDQQKISESPEIILSNMNKKKVRFPEDNEIVSDYFESKNYWMEHNFCSSEELINSYKKACEYSNIKPIPILLEQLKGIDARLCHERYDMLNMSNVRLDLKQIECMEEIFKRVQFKVLNFENTNLEDESSASLFEIIEFYESCLKLNISMNSKISYIGFNACSKMLKKTPILESIELKGIMFTDTTIPPLNRALRCGTNLRILHMENSNICSKNLLILTSALKLNIQLKELHLSNNRMVPSDGIQLGSLLKVNRHIETLDVRNNSLGDIGLSHICDGLCEQLIPPPIKGEEKNNENQGQGLLCLILWSNSITHNGMPALSEALKVNKTLQSLNLGNNQIGSEGIHVLREGLLINRSLLRLSLPCCKITCEGGVAIAEYLADTKQLIRLDLRDNDIRTAGLMAISHSMKVNKSLIRLDVDQISKRDPVRSLNIKAFIETQMDSLRLIQNRILENKTAVMKSQEVELANFTQNQSLSNNQENVAETSSESIVMFPPVFSETSISELKDSNCLSLPLETISTTEMSTLENKNSDDNSFFTTNSIPANMSLSFSKDIDTSFDSPLTMSNNFSNKVLSPTDTFLEFNIGPKFQSYDYLLTNANFSTADDDDVLFVSISDSEFRHVNSVTCSENLSSQTNDQVHINNSHLMELSVGEMLKNDTIKLEQSSNANIMILQNDNMRFLKDSALEEKFLLNEIEEKQLTQKFNPNNVLINTENELHSGKINQKISNTLIGHFDITKKNCENNEDHNVNKILLLNDSNYGNIFYENDLLSNPIIPNKSLEDGYITNSNNQFLSDNILINSSKDINNVELPINEIIPK